MTPNLVYHPTRPLKVSQLTTDDDLCPRPFREVHDYTYTFTLRPPSSSSTWRLLASRLPHLPRLERHKLIARHITVTFARKDPNPFQVFQGAEVDWEVKGREMVGEEVWGVVRGFMDEETGGWEEGQFRMRKVEVEGVGPTRIVVAGWGAAKGLEWLKRAESIIEEEARGRVQNLDAVGGEEESLYVEEESIAWEEGSVEMEEEMIDSMIDGGEARFGMGGVFGPHVPLLQFTFSLVMVLIFTYY